MNYPRAEHDREEQEIDSPETMRDRFFSGDLDGRSSVVPAQFLSPRRIFKALRGISPIREDILLERANAASPDVIAPVALRLHQ